LFRERGESRRSLQELKGRLCVGWGQSREQRMPEIVNEDKSAHGGGRWTAGELPKKEPFTIALEVSSRRTEGFEAVTDVSYFPYLEGAL